MARSSVPPESREEPPPPRASSAGHHPQAAPSYPSPSKAPEKASSPKTMAPSPPPSNQRGSAPDATYPAARPPRPHRPAHNAAPLSPTPYRRRMETPPPCAPPPERRLPARPPRARVVNSPRRRSFARRFAPVAVGATRRESGEKSILLSKTCTRCPPSLLQHLIRFLQGSCALACMPQRWMLLQSNMPIHHLKVTSSTSAGRTRHWLSSTRWQR